MFRQCPQGPRQAPGPHPPATSMIGAVMPRSDATGIAFALAIGRAANAATATNVFIIFIGHILCIPWPRHSLRLSYNLAGEQALH